MTLRSLQSLALLALLAACASAPSGPPAAKVAEGEAERPVSEQPVVTDQRRMARSHVELGNAYLQSGRIGTAMEEARVSVAIDPSYAPAQLLLASVHALLDEKPAAQKAFEAAVAVAPGDPEVNNAYGWFLCTNGREKEGLERLAKAQQNPFYTTPTRPATNAGLCMLRMKDEKGAASQFAKAYTLDPSNTVALFNLAELAFKQGDFTRARALVTELNQRSEVSAESVWLGLRIERKLGHQEAMESYAQKLKGRFPDSQQYQDYLAGNFE